jgi:3-oxoacyl-[acyl-carrier protein] reductase/pteridine reductase
MSNELNATGSSALAVPPVKRALVTGAAKRIGRELALALAHAGIDVAITYRSSQSEALETVAAIQQAGVRSTAIQMDVRDELSIRAAVAEAVSFVGGLDLLVNNAAVFESTPLAEMTLDQWDRVFETNARGPFLVTREALPYLKAARGRIINLGSLGADHVWPLHAHYCASKAALHMLSETMAKAFAPEVSVNCVAPGYIEMEELEAADRFRARTPMGRNGTPQEVAQAVLFFATAPHFITGQTLAVDGGLGL